MGTIDEVVKKKVKTIAWLYITSSIFFVLLMVGFALLSGKALSTKINTIGVIFYIIWSIWLTIVGINLLKFKPWVRVATICTSIMNIVACIIYIILVDLRNSISCILILIINGYLLWYFFKKEVKELFVK